MHVLCICVHIFSFSISLFSRFVYKSLSQAPAGIMDFFFLSRSRSRLSRGITERITFTLTAQITCSKSILSISIRGFRCKYSDARIQLMIKIFRDIGGGGQVDMASWRRAGGHGFNGIYIQT